MKRTLCLLAAVLMMVTVFAGCSKSDGDVWESYFSTIEGTRGDKDATTSGADSDKDSSGKDTTSKTNSGKKGDAGVTAPSDSHKQGELVVDGAGKDKNANYNVKGTVTVSIDTARVCDYQALFDSFKKVYPNVKLKFDYFAHSGADAATEYLTTRAASGTMPDIVFNDAGPIPTYLLQGWMHPLDAFVKNDSDYQQYVPNNLKNDYTYGGKLYALPLQAHFETFQLNTDVLNALNLNKPALDWTVKDFEDYCRKATTDKYSAQEDMGALYSLFANCYDGTSSLYGYNQQTKTFSAKGTIDSIKALKVLRSVPGLEANALKSGSGSDYAKKFGTGGWADGWVAYHKGLTLFHGLGTWEYKNKRETVTNFNWIMWTCPQAVKGRMPYHVDHSFMTSSCKDKEAAFQLLRYTTYSTEGNIARLSMYDDANKGKYSLQASFYYPTTTNPKVIEKFKSLPGIKAEPVAAYLQENIGNCYRYDFVKIVPDWNNVTSGTYNSLYKAASGADSLVEQTVNQAISSCNTKVSKAWSDFEKKLADVQKKFDQTNR